jgi:uncharacterized ion transporter superfamily protein YfcC
MVGGAFWILNETKAIDVGIFAFLGFTRKMERFRAVKLMGVNNIIITLIMILFSLFGALFGMSEETIAFAVIFVPLAISMGYDSLVGIALCFFAAHIGFAGGIIAILSDGQIIDTVLNTLSGALIGASQMSAITIMYGFQSLLNLVITSGSAKAALTIPIMAEFSDIVGLSRQATIIAFQFGAGFTDMIAPTSGVLMGVLGMAMIPYVKWLKWIMPILIILVIIGFLLLIPTVTMKLNGF